MFGTEVMCLHLESGRKRFADGAGLCLRRSCLATVKIGTLYTRTSKKTIKIELDYLKIANRDIPLTRQLARDAIRRACA